MGATVTVDPAGPARISSSDALMWRIEANPVLRSPILVVGLLHRPVEPSEVRAALAGWVERFPRFRQRAVIAAPIAGGSRWVDDEQFSLDHHLRVVEAPAPADLGALLDLARPTAAEPFDPARAPWTLTLVEHLADGRAGFILRFHHTISDGVGAVQLAAALFGADERPVRSPATREEVPATAGTTMLSRVVDVGRRIGQAGALATSAAANPRRTAGEAMRMGRSVAKALAPVPAPLSPVFATRGLDRHLDVVERPVEDLRRAARAFGCSINDVLLAAIGGALHEYHRQLGHEVPALRFTMPISLRRQGDAVGGNHFAPARFVLPIDDPDPAIRAQIAQRIARRWRDEPALARTGELAALLDLLPGPVVTHLFGKMLEKIDVDAVDVPGLDELPVFAGAVIERMWAFAPPTGAALSITLLSHAGTGCIGINADARAVPEPETLRRCLEAALDQVTSPAGVGVGT